jgi:fructose-bisphosphate aldolase class 1
MSSSRHREHDGISPEQRNFLDPVQTSAPESNCGTGQCVRQESQAEFRLARGCSDIVPLIASTIQLKKQSQIAVIVEITKSIRMKPSRFFSMERDRQWTMEGA